MITPKTPTVKIAYLRTLAAKAYKTKQWGAEALFRLKADELIGETMSVKKWMGSKPIICDLCSENFDEVFYDARVSNKGMWGLVCQKCFSRYECKLGLGSGQKYSLETLEKLEG